MGFFDVSSGPSVKFATIGDKVTGIIDGPYREVQQTKYRSDELLFDKNGQPVMQAIVTLKTDLRDPADPEDDGVRLLYVAKWAMKKAIADAIKAAGASDLEPGGTLTVEFSGERPTDGGDPQKLFTASYSKPGGGFFGTTTANAPQAAPVAPAPVQQAPAAPPVQAVPTPAPQPAAHAAATPDMNQIRGMIGIGMSDEQIVAATGADPAAVAAVRNLPAA